MRVGLAGLVGSLLLLASAGSQGALAPVARAVDLSPRALLPPPRAPAHGHRHAHRSGALLRFDAQLGVYTVTGADDVYFFGNGFIRSRDGHWEFSPRPGGPWSPGRAEWVPVHLRAERYRDG